MGCVLFLVMDNNLHFADSSTIHLNDLKRVVAILNPLPLFQEVAFQFQQNTCYCVSITVNIIEFVVANFKYLAEVTHQSLALKKICVDVQSCVRPLFLIVFVVDFADNFFKNILEGYQSACTAELVDNYRDMHLICLEITQKIINFLCLRHKIWLAHQTLPTERLRF